MKKNFFILASSVLFSLIIFTTCGLDTYYTLSPPTGPIHTVDQSNTDPDQNYLSFTSAVNTNPDTSFRFLGTAVYYRIYASASTMLSHRASISAVNTSSDYSAAANRMISYGYQQLYTSDGSIQPLISAEGRKVEIRLTNNQETVSAGIGNTAQISIDSAFYKTPRRALGTNKTFDFGRYDKESSGYTPKDNYTPPASDDEDFENGTVEDNKYYVTMYAVAIGRDTTYTTYYSNVLYLGTIVIDANNEHN